MTIGIVLAASQEVPLVCWAALTARARHEGLVVFWETRRRGNVRRETSRNRGEIPGELKSICDELTEEQFRWLLDDGGAQDAILADDVEIDDRLPDAETRLPLEIVSIQASDMTLEVEREVTELGVSLLILPRDALHKGSSHELVMHRHLLSHVACEVMLLTQGKANPRECRRIMALVGEGPHSVTALQTAKAIADIAKAKVTALYVEPEVDEVARQVGEQILSRNVNRALGVSQKAVDQKVVLANDVVDGIQRALDGSHDLILLGMRHHGRVHQFFFKGVSERLVQANPGPAIAIVRTAMPLTSRVLRSFDTFCRSNVPQLTRERRVELVERIQSSSRWDFDFVVLTCLSTLIAAGGLVQDSAAIVIGAMLVAPLMTPLLGTGLSLIQGNWVLFRGAIQAVWQGFLLAFALGWLVASVMPNLTVSAEMVARGSPRLLDLLVALVSGVAAAYATGRPNLLSALPGVAIAASLVPPIATAGLATRLGDYSLAAGAALLFFTNIVAIVLGTVISFWAVGIRGTHQHGGFNRWALGAGLALVLITFSLGVFEAWPSRHISTKLHGDIASVAETEFGQATCAGIRWNRTDGVHQVEVLLQSPLPLSDAILERIRELVRQQVRGADVITIKTELSKTFGGKT